jgi:hypothetical protein
LQILNDHIIEKHDIFYACIGSKEVTMVAAAVLYAYPVMIHALTDKKKHFQERLKKWQI